MSTSSSACLVLNCKVAMREDVCAAVYAVRDEGCRVEVRVTWEGGDAGRFARQAAAAVFGVVVAGGGDGTVNEVVGGLVDAAGAAASPPSLGVVPLGTANDLARACGIPLDPFAALRLAVSGSAVPVDVGRARGTPTRPGRLVAGRARRRQPHAHQRPGARAGRWRRRSRYRSTWTASRSKTPGSGSSSCRGGCR